MFGFNVNFGGMNEQLEIFDCMITINVNNNEQKQRLQAPRIIIEQQFLNVCQEIANMNAPANVMLSRIAQCNNGWNDNVVDREVYIWFKNSSCIDKENENN